MLLVSIKSLAILALASTVAQAAVVTYNWTITYVNANPDGLKERRVVGVNGQYPVPPIHVNFNDTLVINVINQIDEPTALHSHGLFQTGNAQMDGPSMVTQCPIPPGANFTYTIPIEQHGTYWIHGHAKGQYVDGLRAPLIIHNPNEPYKYDGEHVVALSDWYHREHQEMLDWYLSIFNPSGAEPVPESGLINHQKDAKFELAPGKTYRFRIINMSALAMFHVHIDGHEMEIIEVDGIDVERTKVSSFYVTAAQRYSILVTAKNDTSTNYMFRADMDPAMFDVVPPELELNITGSIVYNPTAPFAPAEYSQWEEFDDATLVPLVAEATSTPDQIFTLDAAFNVLNDYSNKATFNDITYVMPKVPTLYTALTMGNLSSNPEVYGKYTHPLIIKHHQWIEIIINNDDPGNHPFHLHGHVFQIVGRSSGKYDPASGPYPGYFTTPNPSRRDTVLVPSEQNVAIRFHANNPGVWLFHCHIEWHLQAGLATTFIEAPEVMPSVLKIDQSHIDHCKALNIPYSGNAAGNEGLDLTGANVGPDPLPGTFTSKGIVALVFTIIAALLGLATVIWYAREDDAHLAAQLAKARSSEEETH
ncbi:MAG: Cupredoxin [Benniella sp.]|nr:MAG: Cupredoxin [Benniella sp.]